MKTLLFLLALPICAQTTGIPCVLKLGSSATMRGLYGGKTQVVQGRVSCKNYGLDPITASGVDIDLGTPTLDTVPASDASAMLTRTYYNQKGQVISRDLTTGLGVWGAIELSAKITFSSTIVGAIVMGAVAAIQYIIPSFTNNEPPLNLSNQCDNVSGVTLASGQTLTCTIYITKPPKSTVLPSTLAFTLGGVPATPGPPPVAPPLQLKAPHTGASIDPRCLENGKDVCMYINPTEAPVASIDTDRVNKIMAAHEAGYLAANGEALPADPCAWDSCMTWESAALR
jgi:hypothetical protein